MIKRGFKIGASIILALLILWWLGAFDNFFIDNGTTLIDTTPAIKEDPILGKLDAPITITEFTDFQCVYCKQHHKIVFPQIKKTFIYTGKVKYVIRDMPITSVHKNSEQGAFAANCAAEQGKYWEYIDILFERNDDWGSAIRPINNFKLYAEGLGLNTSKLEACIKSGKYRTEIAEDSQEAKTLGAEGTPFFTINGYNITKATKGAESFEVFSTVINEILAKGKE